MIKHFEKVANVAKGVEEVGKTLGKWGKKALVAGKGAGAGLKAGLSEASKHTVGDTLKLKGISQGYEHAAKNLSKAKGLGGKSKVVGEALGKAAPSLAVAGAYGAGAKKVYNATVGKNEDDRYVY